MEPKTYAASGVNVEKAESFVERLKAKALRPQHQHMWHGAGGYAALYPLNQSLAIAATTDGVGTKVLIAQELGIFDSIGIDLVAMCANDLICVGATPTFFLDYFATGALDDTMADALIAGIVNGCDKAKMILAGGETAEMPNLYQPGHYDLAGFAVGTVEKSKLITGDLIQPKQTLVAVGSSGIHSNGLSLARQVVQRNSSLYSELLVPTLIYVEPVLELLQSLEAPITGIAHITGGGWRNLLRLNKKIGFSIDNRPPLPKILTAIAAEVDWEEMYKTFNMGMGLAVIVNGSTEKTIKTFEQHGFKAWEIGSTTDEPGMVRFKDYDFILTVKSSKAT